MLELILLIAILVHLFEIVALFCIGYVSILDSTISVEIEGIVEEQNSDREDELGEQAREYLRRLAQECEQRHKDEPKGKRHENGNREHHVED